MTTKLERRVAALEHVERQSLPDINCVVLVGVQHNEDRTAFAVGSIHSFPMAGRRHTGVVEFAAQDIEWWTRDPNAVTEAFEAMHGDIGADLRAHGILGCNDIVTPIS